MQARLAWMPALALTALLAAPWAAAESRGDLSFPFDFRAAHMQVDIALPGPVAQQLRSAMDASGNHDGTVSAGEARNVGQAYRPAFAQSVGPSLRGNISLDGRHPTGVNVTELSFLDAAGPSNSTATMTARLVIEIAFLPGNQATHALVMRDTAGSGDDNQTVTATIQAPPGWTVDSYGGVLDPTVSSDHTQLTYHDKPSFHEDVRVTFAQASSQGSPAPGAALGAVALAAAALLVRRRAP